MREVVIADMITRACEDQGLRAELVYIADTADPLRKVYPFLDQETYQPHVGKSLAEIPAPDGKGSYAEHFIAPFLSALEEIDIHPRVIDNHAAYQKGEFVSASRKICDGAAEIKSILEEVSGRSMKEDWFPWTPRRDDGILGGCTVREYEWPYAHWQRPDGSEGKSDISKGEGKLPWRIDWPARWEWVGVTCEPFGKDHSASGGSWDSGRRIAKWLGCVPPLPVNYEWIYLKGKGAMSSSTGVSMSAQEFLSIVPPSVLRHLIARSRPERHIDFDPRNLLQLADEHEKLTMRVAADPNGVDHVEKRRSELSLISGEEIVSKRAIGSTHLSLLVQAKPSNEAVLEALSKTHGIDHTAPSRMLNRRIEKMRTYVESAYFPEKDRLTLLDRAPKDLTPSERAAGSVLAETWRDCDVWHGETLQAAVREAATKSGFTTKQIFGAGYRILLGRSQGPRLGPLAEALGKESVLKRLDLASH